jgi:hypothetical protein
MTARGAGPVYEEMAAGGAFRLCRGHDQEVQASERGAGRDIGAGAHLPSEHSDCRSNPAESDRRLPGQLALSPAGRGIGRAQSRQSGWTLGGEVRLVLDPGAVRIFPGKGVGSTTP